MKITWLGHSGFLIEGSQSVVIDPFLTGNPRAPVKPEDIKKCDVMLITHDHSDHMGDAVPICRATGATVYSTAELATMLAEKEGLKTEGMNIGGTLTHNGVEINIVNAQHSTPTDHQIGFVVIMDGKCIYHAGDTGLFGDMKIIGDFFKINLALIPIGDRYTMGTASAARAVELLRCEKVIPMHYNTFPIIEQDPQEFVELVGPTAEVIVLTPGQSCEL
jgi:L-ascorbate metabolism protein UlaG (beta-lactamase superfamily)